MKRLIVITAAALIAARRLRLSRKQSNWAWSKINQVCMRMRPERSQILPPRWQWKSQVLGGRAEDIYHLDKKAIHAQPLNLSS